MKTNKVFKTLLIITSLFIFVFAIIFGLEWCANAVAPRVHSLYYLKWSALIPDDLIASCLISVGFYISMRIDNFV